LAEAGASALAGLGYGIGFGTAYASIVDILRTTVTWSKWKVLGYQLGYPVMADVMQKLLEAEKDEVHGLSSKGMIDTIWGFIDRTMDFSMLINESVATQLFVQMIQQSIAYAIHSSHAGSIGTICNVYSGSTYLSGAEGSSIARYSDYADREFKAFLSAELGRNIPTTAFDLLRGANERIEDRYRKVVTDIDGLLTEWNDLALNYYRHYHSMARTRLDNAITMKESATERAYGILEQIGNEHLARISEQLDTLQGCKSWWDAGFLTDDELRDIAIRIKLEKEASEDNYDEYKADVISAIAGAIATWDAKVTQALGDLTDNEAKYNSLVKSVFSTLFADVSDFANEIVNAVNMAVEDVCAYRNVGKALGFELISKWTKNDYMYQWGTSSPYKIYYAYNNIVQSLISETDIVFANYGAYQRKYVYVPLTKKLYAIYPKTTAGRKQIFVKESSDGGVTWTNETKISTLAGMENYDQWDACISVDGNGVLHAIWIGGDAVYTTHYQLWYAKYDGSWSTPLRLSTVTGMQNWVQYGCSITVGSDDKLYVVWSGCSTAYPNYCQVWYTKYDGTWSSPIRLSTYSGMENYYQDVASITVDYAGKLHVVWCGMADGFDVDYQIWYVKYDGSWSSPIRISTYSGMGVEPQYTPSITIDVLNRIHVVWDGCATGFTTWTQIWYAKYDGSWSTPIRLSTLDEMDDFYQEDPTISVTDEGYLYVLWGGQAIGDGGYSKIYRTIFTTSWSTPDRIQSNGDNHVPNLRWSAYHQK